MKTSSRRDDLISLCYMLVFLLDNELPYFKNINFKKWDFDATKIDLKKGSAQREIFD